MNALQKVADDVFLLSGDSYPEVCSNVYVLEGPDSVALIDSGVDANRVEAAIAPLGKPIETVFFTHGHFDHVQAAIKAGWSGPMAKEDLDGITELNAEWVKIKKPAFFKPLKTDRIAFANFSLQVISTPGHTPGSVCYFEKKNGILFSGDTKFSDGGQGRTDFWGGDAQALQESLARVDELPYRILAPGHGTCEEK